MLVEVDGCVYDADEFRRSGGYEREDPVGREAFVNHMHLNGDDRAAEAARVIAAWEAAMREGWPGRKFRIYRQVEAHEVTIRFHMVRPGVPNWSEEGIEIIVVGGRNAETGCG
jgi:hypothetical protein